MKVVSMHYSKLYQPFSKNKDKIKIASSWRCLLVNSHKTTVSIKELVLYHGNL